MSNPELKNSNQEQEERIAKATKIAFYHPWRLAIEADVIGATSMVFDFCKTEEELEAHFKRQPQSLAQFEEDFRQRLKKWTPEEADNIISALLHDEETGSILENGPKWYEEFLKDVENIIAKQRSEFKLKSKKTKGGK